MTVTYETGVVQTTHTPRASSRLRRFWRLLRRWRRNGDAYFDLSDFDQRLIYGLGIEPIELRRIEHGGQLDAIMRLRRMRRRVAARSHARARHPAPVVT